MPLGGLSEITKIDDEVINLVSSIKRNFEELNYVTETFEPINFKIQIVNGTNFFVKVKTDKEYVHLRIYKSLSGEIEFNRSKLDKKLNDDIIYF